MKGNWVEERVTASFYCLYINILDCNYVSKANMDFSTAPLNLTLKGDV